MGKCLSLPPRRHAVWNQTDILRRKVMVNGEICKAKPE
jgi:hypothetical protein